MAGLPIPSEKGAGGRASKVIKQTGNAVTPVDPRNVEVLGPNGQTWSLLEVQEWLRDHPGDAPQFGNGGGPSFHKHGDTHTHVTVQAAPSARPQPPEKTFGQQAAEFGASAAGAVAMAPVHALIWLVKSMWESNQEQQRRAYELQVAQLRLQEEQLRRSRFNETIGFLISHLVGFGMFMVVVVVLLVVVAATPRWNYVPWGWWDYPPPPPAYHRSYRDYEQVR